MLFQGAPARMESAEIRSSAEPVEVNEDFCRMCRVSAGATEIRSQKMVPRLLAPQPGSGRHMASPAFQS